AFGVCLAAGNGVRDLETCVRHRLASVLVNHAAFHRVSGAEHLTDILTLLLVGSVDNPVVGALIAWVAKFELHLHRRREAPKNEVALGVRGRCSWPEGEAIGRHAYSGIVLAFALLRLARYTNHVYLDARRGLALKVDEAAANDLLRSEPDVGFCLGGVRVDGLPAQAVARAEGDDADLPHAHGGGRPRNDHLETAFCVSFRLIHDLVAVGGPVFPTAQLQSLPR